MFFVGSLEHAKTLTPMDLPPDTLLPYQRLCILEYRPSSLDLALPAMGPSLLLAYQDQNERVALFLDPQWRDVVSESDRDEVASLLIDFVERAASDPEFLLKQLAELNFGCLVTRRLEGGKALDLEIRSMLVQFARLTP